MKKFAIMILLSFAVSSFMLHAQTEKGKIYIAGASHLSLNLGGEKYKYGKDVDESSKYSYHEFAFMPQVGYTIIKDMPVGLAMYLDCWGEKSKDDNDKTKENSFAVGPFVRYYFADLIGLKPYGAATIAFGTYRYGTKSEGDDSWDLSDKDCYFMYQLGAGLTYFFNDYIGVDLFLGFHHYSYSWDYSGDSRASDSKEHDIYNEFVMQMGMVCMLKCKR